MSGALSGIKVLDLSRVLAGPWAGQLLADLGAEVVKVERPGVGDDTRQWAPPMMDDGTAAYFLCANRGKLSITVDITRPEGQEIIRRLVQTADVLIENYKVGDLARYGLDYESLQSINPGLVYCSITGFGQTGPYAHRAGYDYIVQGMSGLMSVTGPADGEPHKVGVAVTDLFTGLYACNAIQAALYARLANGRGQYIDMALFDCAVAMLANINMNWLVGGQVPPRLGNAHPNIVPYQVFEAGDKQHFILACGNDKQFKAICRVLGEEGWAEDERFITNPARVRHRSELVELLSATFLSRDRDAWLQLLEHASVPCGPINTVDQALADPQLEHRGRVFQMTDQQGRHIPMVGAPITMSESSLVYHHPPPHLGEHTDSVLQQLGYSEDELLTLRQQGAIG